MGQNPSAIDCWVVFFIDQENWLFSCCAAVFQSWSEFCLIHLFSLLLVQSSVCLKLLAFNLLELLLLSSFPEMDYIFRPLHEQKYKFGEFSPSWRWCISSITDWEQLFFTIFFPWLRYIVLFMVQLNSNQDLNWWSQSSVVRTWVQFVSSFDFASARKLHTCKFLGKCRYTKTSFYRFRAIIFSHFLFRTAVHSFIRGKNGFKSRFELKAPSSVVKSRVQFVSSFDLLEWGNYIHVNFRRNTRSTKLFFYCCSVASCNQTTKLFFYSCSVTSCNKTCHLRCLISFSA